MGRKNKKGAGAKGAAASAMAGENKDPEPALSKSAKREVAQLVTQLLEICSKPPSPGAKEFEDYPEIHGLVEKIRKIQSSMNRPASDRQEAIPAFLEWLAANGVDTSAVEIQAFPGYGLGLRAKKDIKESDLIVKIPRSVMMTVDSAMKTPLGDMVREDKILQVMPNVTLAMHLLQERSLPNSFWKPYLDTLPSSFSTPLYFSPEDLQYFKGSPTLNSSITQYRSIARQYAYFYRLLAKQPTDSKITLGENFTFDDYRWAVSAVMTRQNMIPKADDSQKKTHALIPLWDMCNHTNGLYTTDYDTKNNCSLCYAKQDVAADQQIFMFYGPRSNGEFLVHNGFVFPENEHDRLAVKLGISKSDPLCEAKTELLGKINLQATRAYYLHCGECPLDGEMLAFLRVFCMDEDTLTTKYGGDVNKETLGHLTELENPVSPENEEKVWSFLETRVALLLRSYPTSVKEDEEQLKESDLPDTLVMALNLRIGEKRILQQAASFASRRKLMSTQSP